MNNGRAVTPALVSETIAEELEKLGANQDAARLDSGKLDLAARLFDQITTGAEFPEFMTLVAYEHVD